MVERYLARGCAVSDIHEVISKRLYLPGSDQGILHADFFETPPGLFFSQGRSFNIVRWRQKYAVSEVKKAGKMPCVITMQVNEENFTCIKSRVWIPRSAKDLLTSSGIRFKYEPAQDFKELLTGSVAVLALDRMSDEELVAVHTRIGLLLPGRMRFQYKTYEQYLKRPEFKQPSSQSEFAEWLKRLK